MKIGNRNSPITIVAAITSTHFDAPIIVQIEPGPVNGLKNTSYITTAHIRSVDKSSLVSRIGKLIPEEIEKLDKALKVSLALKG